MDRQKLLTIFGVAWISAALLTWFLYARTKAPQQEKTVSIVAAARDLNIGHKVAKEDLKLITIIERDAPRTALSAPAQAIGRALIYPVSAGEPLTSSRLTSVMGAEGVAATIEPGKRAMSVQFTDATGASGLLQPRSRVDVLFTRTGSVTEALTVTLLEDVEVISIGRLTQIEQQAPGTTAKTTVTPTGQQRTATLVVTPEEAQKLELAKNQGRIGLSLRNPADRSTRPQAEPATMEQIEPMLVSRVLGRKAGKLSPSVRDRKAWAKLIGEEAPAPPKPPEKKEPPKPRAVIDVYHGEKHVQEIFQ